MKREKGEIARGCVPRLRFPEFRDEPEWEEKTLGEFSQIVRGGSPRPIDDFLTTEANGLNWLKIGDVNQEAKYVTHTQDKVILSALKKTRVVNPGDLILSNSMSFGRPYILKIETCIHDGWIAITKIQNSVNIDYLYYSISSPASQSYFSNNAAGSGVQNLNADIIKLLPSTFPKPSEQQKIADCLSSLDELIAAQTQKVNALKAHKKGLMQQLFPAEGEIVPKLRFAEFRDAGEWEEKPLGKVAKIVTGNTPSTANSDYYGGNRQFVSPADISDNRYITSTKTTLTEAGFKGTRPVKANSILFVCIGSTIGKISQNRIECATNQQINAVIPFSGYSNNFIYSSLECNAKKIASTAGKHAVPIINKTDFSNSIICVPSFDEQQKIADCLSSLDELIATQTKKMDVLKAHKKGLMQQLFPSADEVIG